MTTPLLGLTLAAALAAIAVADWRTRTVPLKLSAPILLAGYGAMLLRNAPGALAIGGVTLVLSELRARARMNHRLRLGLGLATTAAGLSVSLGSPAAVVAGTAWALTWVLWEANIIRGGDAVTFIGLVGLYPDLRFVALTLAVVIASGLALLVAKHGGWAGARDSLALAGLRAGAGAWPTPSEVEAQGDPVAFMLSLAGIAYTAFVVAGGGA